MENNTSDPEYRNLFRANNQFKNSPRTDFRQNDNPLPPGLSKYYKIFIKEYGLNELR